MTFNIQKGKEEKGTTDKQRNEFIQTTLEAHVKKLNEQRIVLEKGGWTRDISGPVRSTTALLQNPANALASTFNIFGLAFNDSLNAIFQLLALEVLNGGAWSVPVTFPPMIPLLTEIWKFRVLRHNRSEAFRKNGAMNQVDDMFLLNRLAIDVEIPLADVNETIGTINEVLKSDGLENIMSISRSLLQAITHADRALFKEFYMGNLMKDIANTIPVDNTIVEVRVHILALIYAFHDAQRAVEELKDTPTLTSTAIPEVDSTLIAELADVKYLLKNRKRWSNAIGQYQKELSTAKMKMKKPIKLQIRYIEEQLESDRQAKGSDSVLRAKREELQVKKNELPRVMQQQLNILYQRRIIKLSFGTLKGVTRQDGEAAEKGYVVLSRMVNEGSSATYSVEDVDTLNKARDAMRKRQPGWNAKIGSKFCFTTVLASMVNNLLFLESDVVLANRPKVLENMEMGVIKTKGMFELLATQLVMKTPLNQSDDPCPELLLKLSELKVRILDTMESFMRMYQWSGFVEDMRDWVCDGSNQQSLTSLAVALRAAANKLEHQLAVVITNLHRLYNQLNGNGYEARDLVSAMSSGATFPTLDTTFTAPQFLITLKNMGIFYDIRDKSNFNALKKHDIGLYDTFMQLFVLLEALITISKICKGINGVATKQRDELKRTLKEATNWARLHATADEKEVINSWAKEVEQRPWMFLQAKSTIATTGSSDPEAVEGGGGGEEEEEEDASVSDMDVFRHTLRYLDAMERRKGARLLREARDRFDRNFYVRVVREIGRGVFEDTRRRIHKANET